MTGPMAFLAMYSWFRLSIGGRTSRASMAKSMTEHLWKAECGAASQVLAKSASGGYEGCRKMSQAAEVHLRRCRDAVRLLHILDACGAPVGRVSARMPSNAVKLIDSATRLQKLDFWVRYPGYLAHELLNQFEDSGDETLLVEAEAVMGGIEPELRTLGMLRFLFGAYEPIDDAMATLQAYGMAEMVVQRRPGENRVDRREFFLTRAGAASAAESAVHDSLRWYAERAALVARVAGSRKGAALKKAQYSVDVYENTIWNKIITPIDSEVRERLGRLRAAR